MLYLKIILCCYQHSFLTRITVTATSFMSFLNFKITMLRLCSALPMENHTLPLQKAEKKKVFTAFIPSLMSCTEPLLLHQPFPKQALVFTCLQYKSFENTAGKGEIARYEQFLLFPQCFLPFKRTSCHFYKI